MTGYNLAHMAAPDGSSVDLGQLFAGSEGSLGRGHRGAPAA